MSLSRTSTVSELRIWPARSPDGLRAYPERAPVFLLRQHYDDETILCDFLRTLELVRERGPRELDPRHFLHWFPDGATFDRRQHTYSILEALLLRVNGAAAYRASIDLKRAALFAKHGAALAEDKAAASPAAAVLLAEKLRLDKLDLYWKIYLSQHFDLMLCVQDTLDEAGKRLCMLSDEDLLHDDDDVPENAPFYRNLPRDELAFWAGDLPDVVSAVSSMGWFWEDSDRATLKLVHVLEKAKNVVCSFRNWQTIIGADCRTVPGLYEMQVLILRASLFRAYPGANACPSLASCVSLTKMFRVNSRDPDAMLRWMDANPRIVWFAWKEFINFALGFDPALHAMLSATPGWARVASSVARGLDLSCDLFNRTGTYSGETEERVPFDCNAMLKRFYDADQVVYSLKVKKEAFWEILTKRLNQHFSNRHKAGDSDFLDSDLVPKETARLMDRYIARLAPDEPLRPRDLYVWSIDHDIVDRLFAQRELYERSPMPDNAIRNRLAVLVDVCPRDFHLLYVYMNKLATHKQVSFSPLSVQVADRQVEALRRKFSLLPWEPVTNELLTSYYCEECVRPHFPVVKPPWLGFKGANEIPSFGHREVCYFWSTDTIRCTKSVAVSTPTSTKGLSKMGYAASDAAAAASANPRRTAASQARSAALKKARAAQEKRMASYRDPDDAHALREVCFVGAVVTIRKQRYAACETCFSVCHYGMDCFSGGRISCGHHREDALSLFRPLERGEAMVVDPYTFASPFLPVMCTEPALEAEAAFASASGIKPEPKAASSDGSECCWFCTARRKKDSTATPRWRTIAVLDENNRIDRVSVCPKQFSIFNGKPHALSDIYDIRKLRDIKRDWEREYGKRALRDQRRMFRNEQAQKRNGSG